MREQLATAIQLHRERLALVLYMGIIVALAPVLAGLFEQAWEESHVFRGLVELHQLVGIEQAVVTLAFIGVVVGLLALLVLDPKKRWQGVLLSAGFAITLVVLYLAGIFIPTSADVQDLVWLTPGLAVGFLFGGGLASLQLKSVGPLEFRRAGTLLYWLLISVLLVSLIEAHLVYPEFFRVTEDAVAILAVDNPTVSVNTAGLPIHLGASLLAVVTMRRFIQYDADEEFFLLGPPASGKSLLLIGAYLEAQRREDKKPVSKREPLYPSQDLMELIENLDREASDWIVEATGRSELKELNFKYVRGSVFPKNVTIGGVDYAGEHLRRLPDALSGEISNPDEELERLKAGVENADTLLLLLDVERFVNKEGLGIAEYFSILEAADEKNIVLVATKSDIFADMFWEETETDPRDNFSEFQRYVTEQLQGSEQFSALLRQTPEMTVYPVYYETEFNEEGERIPIRDENGSVFTTGFDRLMDRLGR